MGNLTRINHIAIRNRSEREAEEFYGEILGLQKKYQFVVDADSAAKIFGVAHSVKAIVFGNTYCKIEVFIDPKSDHRIPEINHICLEVENRELFLRKCREQNVKTLAIPRDGGETIFVKDFEGNLLEIKALK